MKDLGVKVELGTLADSPGVAGRKVEAMIMAAGSKAMMPKMVRVGQGNLFSFAEALSNPSKIGQNVVVLGGGMVGCETAEFLARKGRSVTVIEMLKDVALDVNPFVRKVLLGRLRELKISLVVNTKIIHIGEDRLTGVTDGEEHTFPGDSFVIAVGMEAERSLITSLREKPPEYYEIGDCLEPRSLYAAIQDGYRVGLEA